MAVHGAAPDVQRQGGQGQRGAARAADDVQVGGRGGKGAAAVQRGGVIKVVVAGQDDGGDGGAPHLGDEKLQHGVGDAGVVKDIAGNQQGIGGQGLHAVHHGREGAGGGIGSPVVAQVSVGSVDDADFAAVGHCFTPCFDTECLTPIYRMDRPDSGFRRNDE